MYRRVDRLRQLRLFPPGTNWTESLHLVYLVYLFFQPAFDPAAGLADWALASGLLLAFLPLFFMGYWVGQQAQRALGLASLTLALVGSFWNVGAVVFYTYSAAMMAFVYDAKQAKRIVFGLAAVIALQGLYAVLWQYQSLFPGLSFGFAFIFTIVVGVQCIHEAERERMDAKLRMAQAEIEQLAKLAERERIARDLHDLLGHTLSLITLKAELASKLAERDAARAGQEMQEVERISRDALSEVRAAVRGYRARGFGAELAAAKLALETAGVTLHTALEPVALSADQESVLTLALREAVTNVVRHAGAQHCYICLEQTAAGITLELRDDGCGRMIREGSGLAGMRERAGDLGGTVSVTSEAGTCVRLTLPTRAQHATRSAPALQAARAVLDAG